MAKSRIRSITRLRAPVSNKTSQCRMTTILKLGTYCRCDRIFSEGEKLPLIDTKGKEKYYMQHQ